MFLSGFLVGLMMGDVGGCRRLPEADFHVRLLFLPTY